MLVDLHCHVLPGIDDGAASLEEAAAMCRRSREDGVTTLIATPHLRHAQWWNGERRELEKLHRRLCERVAGEVELYLGGEIAVHFDSLEEIHALPGGELLTLAGSRYVLLELDWHGLGPNILELVHELRVRGLHPVIAHPERVAWVAGDPPLLEALVRAGALTQLTAMSLLGDFGRRVHEVSEALLAAGLVHFVASDTHNLTGRPPGLSRAFQHVERTAGREVAERLFILHPRAVLEDRPLPGPTM